MSQPKRLHALNIPQPKREELSEKVQAYFAKCEEKLGMVPNVLAAYAFDENKLNGFTGMYNELMLGPSGLTKLEREMIAVTVSSINHCFYCLTAHGAAVRELSGDPVLGELMVMNYRAADLPPKQRAMLDFAAKLTETPDRMVEADREALRQVGWSDRDIWDIAATASFFNMSNRMAAAIEMVPNPEYHAQARGPAAAAGMAAAPEAAPAIPPEAVPVVAAEALRKGARKQRPAAAGRASRARAEAIAATALEGSTDAKAARKAKLARSRTAAKARPAAKPRRAAPAERRGAAAATAAPDRARAARTRSAGRRKGGDGRKGGD